MNNRINGEQRPLQSTEDRLDSHKRISITLPRNAYEQLVKRSDYEGRSLSNLAAFLLETAIDKQAGTR
jgi:hypothetical protein